MNAIKKNTMKWFTIAAFFAFCCALLATVPPTHAAQVSVGVNIGAAPDCPYGYYGPEWFTSGVFVGAGPWFHGRPDFRGHVDAHYDVHSGYKGEMPHRGDRPDASRHIENDFHGKDMRDGRGHDVKK